MRRQHLTINNAFNEAIQNIMYGGREINPRGLKCKELIAYGYELSNPRNRIVTIEQRRFSLYYAFGEFLWYLSGGNRLEPIEYYAPSIKQFSDDGFTLNSAYGYLFFMKWFDQVSECIEILKRDKDSRQAIIFMREPYDLLEDTKDVICTNTLHFMIRDKRLNLIVNMRSNDLMIGHCYDVFCFTMLQEFVALLLGVELGSYFHIANSLHIYEDKYEMALSIVDRFSDKFTKTYYEFIMSQMQFNSIDNIEDEIEEILKYEKDIRESDDPILLDAIYCTLLSTFDIHQYWKNIIFILLHKKAKMLNMNALKLDIEQNTFYTHFLWP